MDVLALWVLLAGELRLDTESVGTEVVTLSLEEVGLIFRDGFGIKESERLRKEKRALQQGEREERGGERA